MYPMRLQPTFKDYLWGGDKLQSMFNKNSGLSITAESWELSCHEQGQSVILNGAFENKILADVIYKNPALVGEKYHTDEKFPILVKLIDAKKELSIQVHPSDETAKLEEGEQGKAEMWYIVECDPHSYIYYGLNQKITKKELIDRAMDGSICEVLNKVYVTPGDVFYILPGTIHALGKGIVVAEVQQNSNTTFRIFDYMRKDQSGNLRELHVEKASEVVDYTPIVVDKAKNNDTVVTADFSFSNVFECKFFKVARVIARKRVTLNCNKKSFHSLLILKGNGEIVYQNEMYKVNAGDSYFIPAGAGGYEVIGECEFLLSMI